MGTNWQAYITSPNTAHHLRRKLIINHGVVFAHGNLGMSQDSGSGVQPRIGSDTCRSPVSGVVGTELAQQGEFGQVGPCVVCILLLPFLVDLHNGTGEAAPERCTVIPVAGFGFWSVRPVRARNIAAGKRGGSPQTLPQSNTVPSELGAKYSGIQNHNLPQRESDMVKL